MRISISTLTLGAALALAAMLPAHAEPAAKHENKDDAIVVTARRMEENLQDVPISIMVFDQDALTDRNISDAQDLVTYTPSLSTNARFGTENATYSLRGFFQETGTGPSVGIYFADVVAPRGFAQGIPAGDGAGPGSFFDLQNVQVLSGPQGTLFGRNTTGGAVLLVPKKPTDRYEGYVEGAVGNRDMRRVQAVVNAPITDAIRVRLGADYMDRDGYLISDSGIGKRDFNDVDYGAFRASVVADITPEIENYTIFSYSESENNGSLQKISDCYPNAPPSVALFMSEACATFDQTQAMGFYHTVSTMRDPVSRLRQWQVINNTTWQVSDNLTIKNIASYARLKNKLNTPLYGTQFYFPTGPFMGDVPVDFVHIRTLPGDWIADQSTFTEELQFQGTALDGALRWQAGGYYEKSLPKSMIGSQPVTFLTCSDPDNLQCIDVTALSGPPAGALVPNFAKTEFRSQAVFAQASYDLNKQFTLTGGLRFTWDEMSALGRLYAYRWPTSGLFGDGPTITCSKPGLTYVDSVTDCDDHMSRKSHKPTWLLGLDYKPFDDVLLYAKYSRGYRTGGVKTDVPEVYESWGPEKVDTYEIGAKTSFNGLIRGRFNIATFYNDFTDQQINYGYKDNPLVAGTIAPGAGPINVGKSRIWGVETDIQLEPVDSLILSVAHTYLNTTITSVDIVSLPADDPYIVDAQIFGGYELPFTPKNKLTLGANYTLPLSANTGEVSIGMNYTYTSKQTASYALRNPELLSYYGRDKGVLESRDIVDLYLNWKEILGSAIDLGVFVTNLTDEKYYTAISHYALNLGFNVSSVGQPRMIGARVKYSFGGD